MTLAEKYEPVIGLEVHAQLSTKSKLFCGDATGFDAEPNTHVSAISLAHPGTLPVMNEAVIALAVKLGVALQCNIVKDNYFARKNYFYPDLPKGYQVSQHTAPICLGGGVEISDAAGNTKTVELNRIHMEEDAGKSIHDADDTYTCVDLNRAGMPLVEIVTEPCIHSAEDAFLFVTELRKILRWLEVCDGNMEEGSLRCDANISVRLRGDKNLNTRVEVKNLNSIRNVKKAIDIEVERLINLTEKGERIVQETRSYNADDNATFSLRNKEEAEDYRYFPEPDLPAFFISEDFLEDVRKTMPVLPSSLKKKYRADYGLSAYDAEQLTLDRKDAQFFELIVKHTDAYKSVANWLTGPIKSYCSANDINFSAFPLTPQRIAAIINFAINGTIDFNKAGSKLLSEAVLHPDMDIETLANDLNLLKESDDNALEEWVSAALESMPEKVKAYQSGKKGLIGLFAGEVKKRSKGKADMQKVTAMLESRLNA